MILPLLLLASDFGPIEPGLDQIEHVRALAEFLADAEGEDIDIDGIRLENRDDASQSNAASLFEYVRERSIENIETRAPTDRNMPVSVRWNCGRLTMKDGKADWDVRRASFWVEDGKVVRVKFGELPSVVMPASLPNAKEVN